tara:strand:- start:2565 stop:4244 length:1680 start_codon:yes stop_codon:yes gene_type:complete
MKPLNLDNSPCSPISSNCVVWQGPDISCINLCTGDTVSDVVYAMAKELCTILDSLKVTNYDLTCFNSTACGPKDFNALIQFLITRICELEGTSVSTTDATSSCPDCVVTVADCFVTGTQTTMQLTDYVQLIGQRVCSIITDISLINSQITDILIRLTTQENKIQPTFTLPTFTLGCQVGTLLSGTTQSIDTVLEQFINNVWCSFHAVTGTTTELATGVGRNCITDSTITLTSPGVTFGVAYSGTWVPDALYNTVADAINNLWISLCDIQTYLTANVLITVADTNTVDLKLTSANLLTANVQDTGWVDLEGFAWYTGTARVDGFLPQCRRIGNVIHFRGTAVIPMADGSGNVTSLTSITSYDTLTTIAPAVGTGSSNLGAVVLNSGGGVFWNQDTKVIPTTVLASTENLDSSYSLPYPSVMLRAITVGANGTRLSAAGSGGINSAGKLFYATLKDQEIPSGMGALLVGSSTLRYITSNVRATEYIPNFINTITDIQNFPATGANPLLAETGFPTTTGDAQWPFTCDAGNETNLGGFQLKLDGLTAFVACSSTAATKTCYT